MAKYSEVTQGQVEACINRMGGMQNWLRYVGGQGEIVFKTILSLLGTVKVAAQGQFIARDYFQEDTSEKAEVKIWVTGSNFKNWFLDLVEESVAEEKLGFHRLEENSVDGPIMAELGENNIIKLSQFHALLKGQRDGSPGKLLVNGYANICYVADARGIVRTVGAGWYAEVGGWNVDAYATDDPFTWSAEFVVVSRKIA